MAELDRNGNDPDLKYLAVERSNFNDPATQAEWTQKRLVWVPHETQVSYFKNYKLVVYTWAILLMRPKIIMLIAI